MHHSEPMGMGVSASGSGDAVVDNSSIGGHHGGYQQQQQQMHQQQQGVPTSQHLGNPMGQMGGQQVPTKVDLDGGYGLIPPTHSRVLNEVPSMYSQMVSF